MSDRRDIRASADSSTAGAMRSAGHVLFLITTTDFGGTESILLELTRRMHGRGLDFSVCSLCPPGQIGHEIEALGVEVFSLGMSANASMAELLKGGYRLSRELDHRRIDLVQSFLYRANLLGALALCLMRHRPLLIQGQRSLHSPGTRGKVRAVRLTRRIATHVVAVSDAVRREMIEMEALSADRISVIRNGVDTTIFKPQDGRGKRLELGLADDEFVVGAVGRLAPVKGVEYLLRGAAIAVERGTPVTLLLVGDGPLRTDLEALSSTLGIRDRVRFMGMRRDLVELYAAMDAFALPSLQEGSPNALMEAMACAKPVMASPVGGVPEIVEPEVSGVLVATGEPEAWGAELVRFATDSELRARLAAGARKRIESEYDIELTVAAHVAFYKSRIEGRRR